MRGKGGGGGRQRVPVSEVYRKNESVAYGEKNSGRRVGE